MKAAQTLPETSPDASDFFDAAERSLINEFLKKGIVKIAAEDRAALDKIRSTLVHIAASQLGITVPKDEEHFLNTIHQHVNVGKLNEFRLTIIQAMNAEPWLRHAYFAIGKRAIETLVGNELVMQRRLNLSIQLPDDDSSLLPIHSDVWSGDSPYEVVLWVPYVHCFSTKSMYFCDREKDASVQPKLKQFQGKTSEDLYRAIASDAPFIDIHYGEALIFTQNIMHGNRVNIERETRWSSNCRFKSALSPYADKKLGEFFDPITLRPATRLGLNYELPTGFDA